MEEGHLRPGYVHMMIAGPPKCAVRRVIGYIRGKSAIHLERMYGEREWNVGGQDFWARGVYVSIVGRAEATVRECVQKQEEEGKRLERMKLWRRAATGR